MPACVRERALKRALKHTHTHTHTHAMRFAFCGGTVSGIVSFYLPRRWSDLAPQSECRRETSKTDARINPCVSHLCHVDKTPPKCHPNWVLSVFSNRRTPFNWYPNWVLLYNVEKVPIQMWYNDSNTPRGLGILCNLQMNTNQMLPK